ncbi:LysE family translocator [Aeromonas caviae]|uniref:LysE family translocator n=1 Tax=Aeromonas caviae TaxID=648 RepID=UPI002B4995E5|nr:LysE family translocator [Aeromonas caviae]
MNPNTWMLFALAYLLATLTPGPNVLLVVKNGLQHGWRAALVSILGNLGCQAILIGLVAMGVGALLQTLPPLFVALKLAGGDYLVYLGYKALRAANTGGQGLSPSTARGRTRTTLSLLREAFLVSASNPKTIVFLCALLPQFLDHQSPLTLQFITMYLTICAIVSLVHLCYVALARRAGRYFKPGRGERLVGRITGGLFITLGGAILLSGRP